jgi:putative membrane protein
LATNALMHVKLGFVFALYLYHGKCQQIQTIAKQRNKTYETHALWNEGATIIFFLRSFFSSAKECKLIYGVIGIISFSVLIMLI